MSIEANKAVIRAFIDSWNSGDMDRLGGLMAEDGLLAVNEEAIPFSPASTRAIAEHWRGAFPDYRFELLDLIAEGDKVVAHIPFSGTQTGQVMDIPPTGKAVNVNEIVIFHIIDGKIAG